MKPVVQKIYKGLSLLLAAVIISSLLLVPGVSHAAPVAQESGEDGANKAYLPMIAVGGEAEMVATPLLPEQYNAESEEAPTLASDQVQGSTCFTYIKFTNNSSYPINIYWVNYSGGESLYKTLSSGKYYWQQTYYGHSWRVRSQSGALIKSYTVYTCSYVYITITNSDFPQPTATPVPATGSIGDRVWDDLNRNGVQDNGEPGLGGVKVDLWVDSNNDGAHDTLVATMNTNSNGNYSFTGLNTSKRYVVKFTLPNCYVFTAANVGSDATDSDVTVLSYGGTDLISLSPNANTVDVDAGMYNNCLPTATNTPVPPTATNTPLPPTATNTAVPPTPTNTLVPPTATNTPGALGSIGNKVWNDVNANGILDTGEAGVPGVTVQLKDCSGNLLRSVTTDGNGNYGFNNQPAGCYLVTVVLLNGFQFSPKDQGGNDSVDSDVNPANGTTDPINLAAGQQIFTVDIGIYQLTAPTATPTNTAVPPTPTNTAVPPTPTKTPLPPTPTKTPTPTVGSIGDRVWKDGNRNGIQDSGEPGIGGVKVELWVDSNNDGAHDTLVGTTNTNSNGNYSFTGLDTSKRYVVKFALPSCYGFTTPNVGSDATDSDVTVFSYGGTDLISLSITAHTVDVDAGMYKCY